MQASSVIQGEIKEIKLSQSEPMMVLEAPKVVSTEEIFRIAKLALPVKCKSDANASNVDECNSQQFSLLVIDSS